MKERKKKMSVDYSSILIYGFKIPLTNENCAAMFRATGGKEFWEYSDIVDEQLILTFERGLIKCERVIKLNNSKFNKNLGIYWSYVEGMGDSHGAIGSGTNITLIGLVDPKDVNWEETIAANLIDPEEYELNLMEDSEIEITKIINTKTKDVIFEGHLICEI